MRQVSWLMDQRLSAAFPVWTSGTENGRKLPKYSDGIVQDSHLFPF